LRAVDYPPNYLRALHGAIIVYDMANPDIKAVNKYFDLIKRYYASNELQPSIAIVGIRSDVTPDNSRAAEIFAIENHCLFYDNVRLSSQADEEILFQKLTRLHLHKMGINGINAGELIDNTSAQHTAKARQIWLQKNLSTDEKIAAILDDYTGRTGNGLARLFSFITNWNKSQIQVVAALCNDFRQKKLTAIELLEQLNNIRTQDVNDPIILIRKFLHEMVTQINVTTENNKLSHH
jgi:hypothetical protein